jgi:hypothetical protein
MPWVVTAQDVVNSPYVVTGETGSVHIYHTPALSEQIKAQQGPALGPACLVTMAAQSWPVLTLRHFLGASQTTEWPLYQPGGQVRIRRQADARRLSVSRNRQQQHPVLLHEEWGQHRAPTPSTYHENLGSPSNPTIYANMPYVNPTYC